MGNRAEGWPRWDLAPSECRCLCMYQSVSGGPGLGSSTGWNLAETEPARQTSRDSDFTRGRVSVGRPRAWGFG